MITVRRMRWWDVATVHRLEMQCFPLDSWSLEQFWQELGQPTREYVVAEDGSSIVGYAGAFVLSPDSDVQTIAVDPAVRGRGIGEQLLEHLISTASDQGATGMVLEVRSDNSSAIGLYERFGFERISRRAGYYPDGGDAVILQRRPLVVR